MGDGEGNKLANAKTHCSAVARYEYHTSTVLAISDAVEQKSAEHGEPLLRGWD